MLKASYLMQFKLNENARLPRFFVRANVLIVFTLSKSFFTQKTIQNFFLANLYGRW